MNPLEAKVRVDTGWFNLHFRGDGSLVPKIAVSDSHGNEAYGYTESKELRRMAKTLKRWAKLLEEKQIEQAYVR